MRSCDVVVFGLLAVAAALATSFTESSEPSDSFFFIRGAPVQLPSGVINCKRAHVFRYFPDDSVFQMIDLEHKYPFLVRHDWADVFRLAEIAREDRAWALRTNATCAPRHREE